MVLTGYSQIPTIQIEIIRLPILPGTTIMCLPLLQGLLPAGLIPTISTVPTVEGPSTTPAAGAVSTDPVEVAAVALRLVLLPQEVLPQPDPLEAELSEEINRRDQIDS